MSDVSQARIIIRHVSGSKTDQVERIPLRDLHEITIGRDPSSTIYLDQRRRRCRRSPSRGHPHRRQRQSRVPDLRLGPRRDIPRRRIDFGEVELAPEDMWSSARADRIQLGRAAASRQLGFADARHRCARYDRDARHCFRFADPASTREQ